MCYNVINFIEIASNSLLNVIDNLSNQDLYSESGVYYLDLKNTIKESFSFYIGSNIENEKVFGYKNILINTCRPFDNWRKKERGSGIKACKYNICDSSISIEKQKLEYFLDKEWKRLQIKKKDFYYIENQNVDIFDLNMVLPQLLSFNFKAKRSNYYIIEDVNRDYIHTKNIPNYLVSQIEMELRKNRLII